MRTTEHQNSFDLIRIVAAGAVLYSHSFLLYGLPEPKIFEMSIGSLAVAVFFAVSGFLICQSWERDPNLIRFGAKRLLRIFPGLLVAVIFTVFIVGLFATRLPLNEYILSWNTSAFLLSNATAVAGVDTLPGVFEEVPYQKANGSLWTLRYELLMYAILAFLGLIRGLKWTVIVAFLLSVLAWFDLTQQEIRHLNIPIPIIWHINLDFDAWRVSYLASYFFGGAVIYILRHSIPLSIPAAALLVGISLVAPENYHPIALSVSIPYAAITLAHRIPPKIGNTRGWDLSYGVYIYAYPVQQLVSEYSLARDIPWVLSLTFSAIITFAISAASWRFIEKPALSLKYVLNKSRQVPSI